jgi:hypothetical protein
MDTRPSVEAEGGVEADLSVDALSPERRQVRLGELELGPGGHRGLP